MKDGKTRKKTQRPAMRWLRRGFLLWAAFATLWLANSMRTRGVDADLLRSGAEVSVVNGATTLDFSPVSATNKAALVFICGSGVAAEAYAPLLRPIADAGHSVFVVKLPYRFAPLESHKRTAVDRALRVVATRSPMPRWVIAGHSLGGALACRVVQSDPKAFSGLVLLGTTHPKVDDLSLLPLPVTKVYGSKDGVALPKRMFANRRLLPKETRWVEIQGGNHSQFGHYGRQLLDGKATISREAQQAAARSALLEMLERP